MQKLAVIILLVVLLSIWALYYVRFVSRKKN